MKNRLALLLCVVLAFHMGACTSNDSRDDEAAPEESMGGDESLENVDGLDADGGEIAEESPADGGDFSADSGDAAATPDASAGSTEEGFSEDALSDEGDATVAENPPADTMVDPGGAPSEQAFTDTPPSSEPTPDLAMQEPPPTSEAPPPPPLMETSSSSGGGGGSDSAKSFPVVALKKIESAPFERDGVVLNTVYFARPGDTFSKVSKKIYGNTQKVKELRNVNPDVMPRVGDPIYYNSPSRPTDAAVMKTYYDDTGIQPKVYVANEGDDLKKISKNLLGFDGAWKEIWASNTIDSKSKMPAGTELKYYSDSELAPAQMAQNTPPAPPEMGAPPADAGMPGPPDMGMPADAGMPPGPDMGMPPSDQMAEVPPPPPPTDMLPPPDSGMDAAAGMNAPPPPDMAPPPPPPPPPENNQMAQRPDMGTDGSDNDVMMALGAAGGIAALLAVVMVMRKRRQQREMAAAFGDTQVGT